MLTPTKCNLTEDMLVPFNEFYARFRNEDDQKMYEDVIGLIVPGNAANTPRNMAVEVAWGKLNKLQPKHLQPKIG